MLERKCTRCDIEHPIEHFRLCKRSNTRRRVCNTCISKQKKEYRERNLRFIYDYLSENPCCECGHANILDLDFDHLDPATKDMKVSNMPSLSLARIKREIDKCQVLCSSCHRKKTAIEGNYFVIEYLKDKGLEL